MTKSKLRIKNHYVPEMYLKRWSEDGLKVLTYPILVPHHRCPVWKHESICNIASRKNLYMRLENGEESDNLEKWFSTEFEEPALPVINRLEAGIKLSKGDWCTLIRFFAAQDVRTPARMAELLNQMDSWLPGLMQEVVEDSVSKLQKLLDEGQQLPQIDLEASKGFPVSVKTSIAPDNEMGTLGVEVLSGRALWLHCVERLLTVSSRVLYDHQWTILRPPLGMQWLTSDNPAIRLNYYSNGTYDLGGGWANKGTELILPLSPEYLLYTQVGARPPQKGSRVTGPLAKIIHNVTVANASRYIFAKEEDVTVQQLRPRVINPIAVQEENILWGNFHNEQLEAEREIFGATGSGR